VNTDGRKSSGGSSKKKKSSAKSSRKKNGKTAKASDAEEENDVDDATDGYDTCSSEKCLRPTGEWPLQDTKCERMWFDFGTCSNVMI